MAKCRMPSAEYWFRPAPPIVQQNFHLPDGTTLVTIHHLGEPRWLFSL
jgi:hypothetical protein